MLKYQNILLSGVAALALIAGAGIASAQQSNEHGAMGGSKAATPQAGAATTRSGGMQPQAQDKARSTESQALDKGNSDRTAQTGNKEGASPRSNARADRMNRGSQNSRQNTAEQQRTLKGLRGDTTKPMQGESQRGGEGKANTANQTKKANTSNQAQKGNAADQAQKGNSNQAQQQNPANETRGAGTNNQGTQANGGTRVEGANVQLTEQQRTQIRQTVIGSRSAPRVAHVDFDVRVGTVVPRGSIHFVPVPETLVQIEPRWRGYEYFVYEDEVVIIDPSDMTIVVIINA
jgi:hypothetical protein